MAPSPANLVVSVYNRDAGPIAASVFDILTEGGFNTSPGILDASEVDPPVKGSIVMYRTGEEPTAKVVGGYFSNMELVPVQPADLPNGEDVAVVVGGNYALPEPPDPGAQVDCP